MISMSATDPKSAPSPTPPPSSYNEDASASPPTTTDDAPSPSPPPPSSDQDAPPSPPTTTDAAPSPTPPESSGTPSTDAPSSPPPPPSNQGPSPSPPIMTDAAPSLTPHESSDRDKLASTRTTTAPSTQPTTPSSDQDGSVSTVFAWFGAIVITAAFTGLIAWGAVANWVVGFIFSMIFTGLLFAGARWLKKEKGGYTVLSSLLFLLFALGIGVTGSFLPVNIWGADCFAIDDDFFNDELTFATDTSSFPSDIGLWFQENPEPNYSSSPGGEATFAYLAESAARTVFVGSNAGTSVNDNYADLFVVSSSAPVNLDASIYRFNNVGLASNAEYACIQSSGGLGDQLNNLCTIGCTDGDTFAEVTWEDGCYYMDYRFSDDDGRIYMIGWVGGYAAKNRVVASVDPGNVMDVAEYSSQSSPSVIYFDDEEDLSDDCSDGSKRKTIIGLLFLSFLPTLVASSVLHAKLSVPSIFIGVYFSITAIVLSLCFLISVDEQVVEDVNRWWLPLSSLVFMYYLVLGFLTNRIEKKALSWSLNFSGLVFFPSTIVLFQIFRENYDSWFLWILLNLICFAPLLLFGIITGRIFLLILGAIGILIDIYRITDEITDAVADGFETPTRFIILAVCGSGLAFLGYYVNRQQETVQRKVQEWSDKFLSKYLSVS